MQTSDLFYKFFFKTYIWKEDDPTSNQYLKFTDLCAMGLRWPKIRERDFLFLIVCLFEA